MIARNILCVHQGDFFQFADRFINHTVSTDICQVVPTVPSEPSEHEPKDDQSCSSECDMDFHIDGDNKCNDAAESALEEDDKNDSVCNC